MIRRLFWVCFFIVGSLPAAAQQHQQIWLDYQVDYPFANQYLLELTGSYQTLLSKDRRWRAFSFTPTFEYNISNRFDFLVNVPILYTAQIDTLNSVEFDPSLGTRFHITQNKRINTRLLFKVEERVFHTQNDNEWQTSTRLRLKGEIWICLNGPNLYTNKLWYTILDYEEFYVTDQQVDERYANRRRIRLGLGYRLDYKNRFEIIFTRQSSRNEIEGGFVSGDNVLQLRYKKFLHASKPVNTP